MQSSPQVTPLGIDGAWVFTPEQHEDDRGVFLEWFTETSFTRASGHRLTMRQANCSVSSAGTLRGIHFADVPPGQAKYVTCASGAVLDVVVDLRVGSPTFGAHETVLLADTDRRALYVGEGLGHGFMAQTDNTVLIYLCSEPYAPGREHGIDPLDSALGIAWPTHGRDGAPLSRTISPKDAAAPTLAQALERGLLPSYEQTLTYRSDLTG